MGESAYYNIYIIATVGAALVAISLNMLQTGEKYIKRYLQIGVDLDNSKPYFFRIAFLLIGAFFLGVLVYGFFHRTKSGNSNSLKLDMVNTVFLIFLYSIWYIPYYLTKSYTNKILWILNMNTTARFKALVDLLIVLLITVPFAYFTFILFRLVILYQHVDGADVFYFLLIAMEIITYILILFTTGLLKGLRSLCDVKNCIIHYKNGNVKQYKILFLEQNFVCLFYNGYIRYENKDNIDNIREIRLN